MTTRVGLVLALLGIPGVAAAQSARPIPLDSLKAAAVRDSNDPTAHYALAVGYWRAKRLDDADRSLRLAVTLAPQYADAYLALSALPDARGAGYWKRRLKQEGEAAVDSAFLEAARFHRRAILINPMVELGLLGKMERPPEGFFVRGDLLVFRVLPWWESEFRKGVNEYRQGKYAEAHARLQKLLDDPRVGENGAGLGDGVFWYHGVAAAHLQNFDGAVKSLAILTGRAVATERLTPEQALPLEANDYRFVLATMYYLGGWRDAAMATFRRALEFDIGLYQAHVQLARIHEAKGELEAALAAWQNAINANPEDPGIVVDRAAALARAGRWEEAFDGAAEAESRNPRDPRAAYLAGIAALRLDRKAEARRAFEHFLRIAPSRYAEQVTEVRELIMGIP